MGRVYINKNDREAAWMLHLIYRNAMESGGVLAFKENGEDDLEKHMELVEKIDSLLDKIR